MKHAMMALSLAALLSACTISKQDSLGDFDEINVFVDSLDWLDYQDALASHFMTQYLTPAPEQEYRLIWRSFKDFGIQKRSRNIMMLARLDGKDQVSEEINALLNDEILDGVKKGDYFYIPQKDVWSQNQYVVYLVAPTKDEMLQRIYDLGELVYDDFEKSYYSRLQKRMYEYGENKDLSSYIAQHFPFTLRIQHDYLLVDESQDDHFIWLRRMHPDRDRSLVVTWFENADSIELNAQWLIKARNKLGVRHYSGDVIVEEETVAEPFRFQRWPALRLEGTWKNPGVFVGGPFRTIAFKDQASNKLFIIDLYVQAIGQRKKSFLDQLDIMAHTFKLEQVPVKG